MTAANPSRGFRRARNIRSAFTLLVLVSALGAAAWFGWQEVLGESNPASTLVCTTPEPGTKQTVNASDVTVNVFNAGRTSGLANETATALEERGFTIDVVANASGDDVDVTNVQITGRAKNAPEVQMLAAHVRKPVIVTDDRGEAMVDLVVGDEFRGLRRNGPETLEVESTVPICRTRTPAPPDA